MLFFAARVVRHPAMQNPTLVVLTDRNDLDDQLFGQFQRCADILGQTPVQASGKERGHGKKGVRRRFMTGGPSSCASLPAFEPDNYR